jgi:hypothetical protein
MAHGDDYDRNNSKLWRLLGTGKLQGRHVHRDSEVGTEIHELPRSSDSQDRSYKGLPIRMAEYTKTKSSDTLTCSVVRVG